jgi:hypothetical protein
MPARSEQTSGKTKASAALLRHGQELQKVRSSGNPRGEAEGEVGLGLVEVKEKRGHFADGANLVRLAPNTAVERAVAEKLNRVA